MPSVSLPTGAPLSRHYVKKPPCYAVVMDATGTAAGVADSKDDGHVVVSKEAVSAGDRPSFDGFNARDYLNQYWPPNLPMDDEGTAA